MRIGRQQWGNLVPFLSRDSNRKNKGVYHYRHINILQNVIVEILSSIDYGYNIGGTTISLLDRSVADLGFVLITPSSND